MSTLPRAVYRNLEEYGVMKAHPGISWFGNHVETLLERLAGSKKLE